MSPKTLSELRYLASPPGRIPGPAAGLIPTPLSRFCGRASSGNRTFLARGDFRSGPNTFLVKRPNSGQPRPPRSILWHCDWAVGALSEPAAGRRCWPRDPIRNISPGYSSCGAQIARGRWVYGSLAAGNIEISYVCLPGPVGCRTNCIRRAIPPPPPRRLCLLYLQCRGRAASSGEAG